MKFIILTLTLLLSLVCLPSLADSDSKPFAEKRVVLQISDSDPFKQMLVLNVTANLLKHYGQDKIDIEIVAFGPGLRLLMAGNSNQPRIASLYASGVQFAACKNTIAVFTKQLGYAPELVPQATPVNAGVVRILDLTAQGYSLIKP